MKSIFSDPLIVKIFHGCDSDLQFLAVPTLYFSISIE